MVVYGPRVDILDEAVRAIKYESNQYPSMMGIKELREATAKHSKNFYDIDLDWENQTMITAGATEVVLGEEELDLDELLRAQSFASNPQTGAGDQSDALDTLFAKFWTP